MKFIIQIVGFFSWLGFRDLPLSRPEWNKKRGWHEISFNENNVTSDENRYTRTSNLIKKEDNAALQEPQYQPAHPGEEARPGPGPPGQAQDRALGRARDTQGLPETERSRGQARPRTAVLRNGQCARPLPGRGPAQAFAGEHGARQPLVHRRAGLAPGQGAARVRARLA